MSRYSIHQELSRLKNKIIFLTRKLSKRILSGNIASPSRIERLTKYINKDMKGIEIAPFHSPIVPKSSGYNCISMDVFDTATLIDKAINNPDPYVSDRAHQIEDVNIVASAVEIKNAIASKGELATFDYIISSHNFEHLPNPIKFLQGCGEVLKPGGILSMAIPDRRKTFDFLRPVSITADFLNAFHHDYKQPSPYQVFESAASFATGFPDQIEFKNDLAATYQNLLKRINMADPAYQDAHAYVFTADSFRLILIECMLLRLIPFSVLEIEDIGEFEFYVHLKNTGYAIDPETEKDYLEKRVAIAKQAFYTKTNYRF